MYRARSLCRSLPSFALRPPVNTTDQDVFSPADYCTCSTLCFINRTPASTLSNSPAACVLHGRRQRVLRRYGSDLSLRTTLLRLRSLQRSLTCSSVSSLPCSGAVAACCPPLLPSTGPQLVVNPAQAPSALGSSAIAGPSTAPSPVGLSKMEARREKERRSLGNELSGRRKKQRVEEVGRLVQPTRRRHASVQADLPSSLLVLRSSSLMHLFRIRLVTEPITRRIFT